jgi:acyl-CoA dehydrogenase
LRNLSRKSVRNTSNPSKHHGTDCLTGIPADAVARAQLHEAKDRWNFYPPIIDELKDKAKKLGLWNMFLSKHAYAEGFDLTNLEYGLIASILGRSGLASEVS